MVRERTATDEFATGGFAPPRLAAYEVSVTFTTDRFVNPRRAPLAGTDECVRPYARDHLLGERATADVSCQGEGTAVCATQHALLQVLFC